MKRYVEFILEKRIAQISSNIQVTFGYDVIKTFHADTRKNERNVTNSEMSDILSGFKDEISEAIISGSITHSVEFVVRSGDISLAVVAEEVSGTYWKLIIKTVFKGDILKTSKNQLVFDK